MKEFSFKEYVDKNKKFESPISGLLKHANLDLMDGMLFSISELEIDGLYYPAGVIEILKFKKDPSGILKWVKIKYSSGTDIGYKTDNAGGSLEVKRKVREFTISGQLFEKMFLKSYGTGGSIDTKGIGGGGFGSSPLGGGPLGGGMF